MSHQNYCPCCGKPMHQHAGVPALYWPIPYTPSYPPYYAGTPVPLTWGGGVASPAISGGLVGGGLIGGGAGIMTGGTAH